MLLGTEGTFGLMTEVLKYSQFNTEDILVRLGLHERLGCCAEVGAADGLRISNTAWLVKDCGWRGWFVEKGDYNIKANYPKENVVVHARMEATPENINDLLPSGLDLLSIDIDGNDYHIWNAYEGAPPVVIIEFNPTKGLEEYIMPYKKGYDRKASKEGRDEYGASLKSLVRLGRDKGYTLYDIDGVNAFFIRRGWCGTHNS